MIAARERTAEDAVAEATGADVAALEPDQPGAAPVSNQAALLAEDAVRRAPALVDEMGPGAPLDPQTRQRMESVFGESFAPVRVHAGLEAAEVTRRHSAQALTVGKHIAFAAGNYRPGTPVGDAMLAHELAHTIQQGSAPDPAHATEPAAPATEPAGAALEGDAELATAGAMRRLWAGPGRATTAGFRDTRPALRSALRVQRCSCGGGAPPVAASARDMARPTFTPENKVADAGAGLDFEPVQNQLGVLIRPHVFFAHSFVWGRGGDPADAPDWTAGFIQTAYTARRVHNYRLNTDDSPVLRRTNELPRPALEGEVGLPRPWYGEHRPFPNFPSRVEVRMTDTPWNPAQWEDDGHQAHLVSTGGRDTFGTWLIVKHTREAEPVYLTWDTWEVDWLADLDLAGHTGTALRGNGAHKTAPGGEGRGALTPVLTGEFSNDLLRAAGFRNESWDGTDRE